jgi:hypothetical protein
MDDGPLLAQCEIHTYRSSGPGGQHRNKVSSAVRLKHRPTGIVSTATESRSQHDNRRMALRRLRMHLACELRCPVGSGDLQVPPVVRECIFSPRGGPAHAARRLEVGRNDFRFWRVAAFLLDLLETAVGRLAEAAAAVGITTSNLAGVFQSERHLLAAAQRIRKAHGHGPLA